MVVTTAILVRHGGGIPIIIDIQGWITVIIRERIYILSEDFSYKTTLLNRFNRNYRNHGESPYLWKIANSNTFYDQCPKKNPPSGRDAFSLQFPIGFRFSESIVVCSSDLSNKRRSAFNVNDRECCRRRGRRQCHGQYGGLGQQETAVPDELQHVAAGGTGTGVFGQPLSGRVHAGGVGPAVGPQGIQSGRKYSDSVRSPTRKFLIALETRVQQNT